MSVKSSPSFQAVSPYGLPRAAEVKQGEVDVVHGDHLDQAVPGALDARPLLPGPRPARVTLYVEKQEGVGAVILQFLSYVLDTSIAQCAFDTENSKVNGIWRIIT